MNNRFIVQKKYFFLFALGVFIFAAHTANAATLYFSPSSGNFSVGDLLTAGVLVNTESKAINNADAVVHFPSAFLEVVSVTKSGSIFSLWVEEPAFSNSAGTISFNGGLPTPGFNGTAGRILNIVFRVKSAGLATVLFSSGAVRANDGLGTDILQTRAQAQFNLISEERPTASPPTAALGVPQAPFISSPTHPDSGTWYANSSPQFSWSLPNDATAVSFAVTKNSGSNPGTVSDGLVSGKKYEAIGDGVWYFHLRLKNKNGWGDISHFKFNIDTENPTLSIAMQDPADITEPTRRFLLNATDALSGIHEYRIGIDSAELLSWKDEQGTHLYETSTLSPGDHRVTVNVYDRAGNLDTETQKFSINALDAPMFTDYPSELVEDDVLKLKGRSYPNATVIVSLKAEDGSIVEERITTNDSGVFSLVWPSRMKQGLYEFWGQVTNRQGARSFDSEHFNLVVGTRAFLQIGSIVISYLAVIIMLIILILILLWMFWRERQRCKSVRSNIKKDVSHAEKILHKTFDLLKEDIREQLKLLEHAKTRRRLTQEEELILKRLKQHLDEAERYVNKEIHDIDDLLGL